MATRRITNWDKYVRKLLAKTKSNPKKRKATKKRKVAKKRKTTKRRKTNPKITKAEAAAIKRVLRRHGLA